MIPTRMYERMPALYIIFGVVAMLLSSNMVGVACGAVLVLAGARVFHLRWKSRRL